MGCAIGCMIDAKMSGSSTPHVTRHRLVGLLMMAIAVLTAHAGTTGRITGIVVDSNHSVIPGVQITATNKAMGVNAKTTSDKKGVYTFLTLSAGQYDIHAEAKGFKPFDRTSLAIHVDSALKLDIVLEAQ